MITEAPAGGGYRIDDLAREAGTTVRNVRSYLDRGLLPRPQLQGRVAYYDDGHLNRLRLIMRMLSRGFSLQQIDELLRAVEQGLDVAAALGLENAVLERWNREVPQEMSRAALETVLDVTLSDETLARMAQMGFVESSGDGSAGVLRVLSPTLLRIAKELRGVGIGFDDVLTLAARVQDAARKAAQAMLDIVVPQLFPAGDLAATLDQAEARANLVQRLRPLAQTSMEVFMAQAMDDQINVLIGERLKAAKEAHDH